MQKKQVAEFDIKDLVPITVLIGIAGIAAVLILQMQEETKADINETASPEAYAAAGKAVEGTAKIPNKLPMIAGVVVIAILVGILIKYLLGRF